MRSILTLLFIVISLGGFSQAVENELKEIAAKLRTEIGSSMLDDMNATMDDLQRIFVSSQDVSDAYIHIQYLDPTTVEPKASQSEIAIHKLLGSELKSNVESSLPEQYYMIADHIKPNIGVYMIEYNEPEANDGYRIHAFFYVKEHWVYIPNAYEIFLEQ